MTEKYAERIVVIIIASIIVISLAGWLVFIAIEEHKQLDSACISAGYDKYTDSEMTFERTFKIECDKKHIINVYRNIRCVKWDKWDECVKSKDFIELKSSSPPW